MHHTLVFVKGDDREARAFVIVLAQIIREGLDFDLRSDKVSWEIELKGGY